MLQDPGAEDATPAQSMRPSLLAVFAIFLRLGLTAFGGPVAHLGYFRAEFVARRRWLTEADYGGLVALCQFLPGPASSQVGFALGLSQRGLPGALCAWLGFTAPTALLLLGFALGMPYLSAWDSGGLLAGLRLAAVAVVAQAVWRMGRSLCPDLPRAALAVAAAGLSYLLPVGFGQVAALLLGAAVGALWLSPAAAATSPAMPLFAARRGKGWLALALYALLLAGATFVAPSWGGVALLFQRFYTAGALVFGGGHVVLPLLEARVVGTGMVTKAVFMAGYGATQAMPGPLFALAAFLGAAAQRPPGGVIGALIALVAIFLPGFLLLLGVLPFWQTLQTRRSLRAVMAGVNAAVVGLLLAAFADPVWTSAVHTLRDGAVALLAFLLLMRTRTPPWLVVGLCAAAGMIGALV